MINGFRIGANEGGHQSSDRVYLVNPKTPCVRMLSTAKLSKKYPSKPAGIAPILTGSGSQTEFDVSYRKQRTENFLTGARTAIRTFQFSTLNLALFHVPAGAFSASKTQQHPAARSRQSVECHALSSTGIQNICGTIAFWGTVRSHGIATVI